MKNTCMKLFLVGFALLGTVLGCGQGSSDGREIKKVPATASDDGARTSCFRAQVRLGRRPAEIDYFVECRSHGDVDQPAYGLGREPLSHKPSRPGFRHIDRHPRVTLAGAVHPWGECSRFGSGTVCSAKSTGLVKIEGNFYVAPSGRCTHIVTVTAPIVQTCRSGECPASGGDVGLTSGLPKGCD
jgi:hypothetical protein